MAEEAEKREGKGFKVEDRRRFSPETGDPRENSERVEAEKTSQEEAVEKKETTTEGLPEISFSAFIISLSTQTLMHLGEIANPLTGKVEADMAVAKQLIDIIGVLHEKTRGNLDSGEEKLVDDVLFDLHMRYVEAIKKK